MPDRGEQGSELEAAIASLEAQRSLLGDAVVDRALSALRQQLAELKSAQSPLGGEDERKIVTILFVDVSGFTALSETLDPEEVRRLINACFEDLVPVVQKYGGTIDKFIGDEIMALFGAPVAHENDPERALRAALELMDAISIFNRKHQTELGLHIGVNSGPVVAGRVGTQKRRDYSVMGDAVNLAARLEDASPTGQIFVGPNTHRLTAAIFNFEPLPPLRVKGKAEPISVFCLIGTKATPGASRGIEGLRAGLVGRNAEMEQIKSIFDEIRAGQGVVLSIVGEAGLGKTRLISDALTSFASGLGRAEGRALSHTAGMSYWMARDLLRALIAIKNDTPAAQAEAALKASVEQATGAAAPEIFPYLARLLELPVPTEVEQRLALLGTEALQSRIVRAFADYVAARAKSAPLVLFWEDLHWCDPSSLGVLESLLAKTRKLRLLIILAYRPDEGAVAEVQAKAQSICADNFRVLPLSPLTRSESGSLIQSLLKIEGLSERVRDLILDRAEGNPFFIEELMRSLLDAGVVVLEHGAAVTKREIETVDVPPTLQGVLSARIDRLTAENKQTLQNASVVGRAFQQNILARLGDCESHSTNRMAETLIELQHRDFIEQVTPPASTGNEYVFKHAITQDVAYSSLLLARRKELHQRVAAAIEELFPDRVEELSGTLGYHFQRAQIPGKALHYLRRAAERAQSVFANTEAIGFYQSALEQIDLLIGQTPSQDLRDAASQIHEGIADIETLRGKQEQARGAYEKALNCLRAENVGRQSRLHRKIAKSWILAREHERAEQSYHEAESGLQSGASSTAEWQQEWLQIQLDRMWLHYWGGQVAEIASLAERIRTLVLEQGTPLQRGSFFQGLTLMALRRDRYTAGEETIANARTSLDAIDESKVFTEIAHARFVLGFTYLWAGKLDPAEEWLRASLKISEQMGDMVLQSRCLTYLAVRNRKRGDIEATRRYAEESLVSASSADMIEYIGMAKGNLAWVHLRTGNLDAAYREASEGAEKTSRTPQGHILLWVALWPLVGVAVARDEIQQAIENVERLLVPPQMAIPESLENELRKSIEAWQREDRDTAKAALKEAADLAKNAGYL